jgi:hypothetical protein
MRRYVTGALGLAVVLAAGGPAWASDPTGVYARITKVVLEPSADKPERVQVWGTFALAVPGRGEEYSKPAPGYLYFSVTPGKEDQCRKEWADLKKVAGTDQCVAFGSRYKKASAIHKADEKPKDPVQYPVGMGVVKLSDTQPMAKALKAAATP